MKSGTLLRQVINKLNEGINFNRTEDRHLFGDIYEQILRDLQSAGNAGEYYTPRAVTQFMVERTNPRLGEIIFDPACGTGGFLTCAIEHIRKREVKTPADEQRLQDCIRGVEKKPMPHLLCVTNMLLHQVEVPVNIRHDNTLSKPYASITSADRVDVILTNPPFGGMEEDGTEKNFPATYRTKETADLFLVLIIHLLRDGGRGAMVLPDGTLFGEGVKTRIKQELLGKVQPPHHRPPAQRRLRPLHRHQDQPPFLHQRRADQRNLVLRASLSAGRKELQQNQAHPHRGVRRRRRSGGASRARRASARKPNSPGASPSPTSPPAATTSTSKTPTSWTTPTATPPNSWPNTKKPRPPSPKSAKNSATNSNPLSSDEPWLSAIAYRLSGRGRRLPSPVRDARQ